MYKHSKDEQKRMIEKFYNSYFERLRDRLCEISFSIFEKDKAIAVNNIMIRDIFYDLWTEVRTACEMIDKDTPKSEVVVHFFNRFHSLTGRILSIFEAVTDSSKYDIQAIKDVIHRDIWRDFDAIDADLNYLYEEN